MKTVSQNISKPTWRLMEINVSFRDTVKEFGLWQAFWGHDIFFGNVPFLKSLVLANIIAWVLLAL